jgi:hypothetical protein
MASHSTGSYTGQTQGFQNVLVKSKGFKTLVFISSQSNPVLIKTTHPLVNQTYEDKENTWCMFLRVFAMCILMEDHVMMHFDLAQ